MDAPQVAASSAALLSLTVQVQSIMYRNQLGPQSTNPRVREIMNELNILRSYLKNLEGKAVENSGPTISAYGQLGKLQSAFRECRSVLIVMLGALVKDPSHKKLILQYFDVFYPTFYKQEESTVSTGSWPLSPKQDIETLERVREAGRAIVAFSSSVWFGTTPLLRTPMGSDTLSPTHDMALKREEVFSWLSTVKFENSHLDAQSVRAPDTCKWILDDEKFLKWYTGRPDVLLCVGKTGAGKTILTSHVIDFLEQRVLSDPSGRCAVAYFYFNYQNWTTIRVVLGTLIKQLAWRMTTIPEPILQLWKLHNHEELPPLEDIFATFIATCGYLQDCFIILEALEECPEESQKSLKRLIKILKSAPCKIFLTQRSDAGESLLRDQLPGAETVEVKAKEADIELFVKWKLSGWLSQLVDEDSMGQSVLKSYLEDQICSRIKENARGSFLLPSLQMRLLLEQTTPGEIKYVLRQLPRTCDEFYRDTLEGIMGLSDSQHRLAKKTFTWLFESFRPLRVEELRHAIAIQEVSRVLEEQQVPSTKTIEFVCKGLVTVDRSYERIALLHPTLQMYLKMNRDSFFPNAKRIVARCCTTYLLFDDLNSGPCVSKNDLEERLHKYPLLPYLCRYWGYHCRDYWRDEVKDSAMRILRDSVLLDSIAQVYHITKNQLRFLDNFKPSPRDLNGLHVVGLFGLIDAAKEIILSEPSLIYSTDSWGRTPLHVAADNGQYAIAELLLANHASVEAKNRHGKTPLHMAAANGHQRIVDLLLKKNADILVKDEDKNTALDLAAGSGEVDVVKRFLEAGIDHQVNGNTTPPTKSAIQKAATTGESQVLEVLLESGAEPDADTLKRAAASGVQETVSLLLECGVSPNSRGSEMKTALHSAAAAGHSGVVRQPIESGADLSISDDQDKTPFFMAVSQGDERMVRRLLEGGADIESQTATGETALLHAAAAGRLPIVKLLLSYGADVNTARSHPKDLQRRETDSPCEQYDNSLQAAAGEGHDKIVHELLLNGADIEITDRKGSRPIHAAAEQNNTAVVKVLLDASCVPDPADVEGRRPIHLAARGGFVETVELLSNSCEVDRNVMDNLKRTPLSYACESASEGVVQVLLSAGVSADEKDEQGRTPLSYAAEAGNESIVLALLRKGVKADTKDNTGHDPLYYASLKKHAAVVKLLRST